MCVGQKRTAVGTPNHRALHPRRIDRYRLTMRYDVGGIRTIFRFHRREGALLLPAAGTNKFPKIPMQTRSILRIRPKLYKFKNFFRRKEQSPFPTFPLTDYAYHPKCQ